MTIRSVISATTSMLLLALFLCAAGAHGQSRAPEKDATFVVLVSWDDAYKTPATGLYIEAHTFAANYVSEKSFVLKMVKAGRYEAALPPGLYDIFVSEASSMARCKRVLIAGSTPYWNLMLEHDDLYQQR